MALFSTLHLLAELVPRTRDVFLDTWQTNVPLLQELTVLQVHIDVVPHSTMNTNGETEN